MCTKNDGGEKIWGGGVKKFLGVTNYYGHRRIKNGWWAKKGSSTNLGYTYKKMMGAKKFVGGNKFLGE